MDQIKENAAKWKFGASKREDMSPKGLSRNPSPQNYTIPTKMFDGPKSTMHARTGS